MQTVPFNELVLEYNYLIILFSLFETSLISKLIIMKLVLKVLPTGWFIFLDTVLILSQ